MPLASSLTISIAKVVFQFEPMPIVQIALSYDLLLREGSIVRDLFFASLVISVL